MALRKKATATPAAEAAPAPAPAAPAAPAKPAKPAKAAAPAKPVKKAAASAEKPNWLVARLRNAVAKNFTDEAARKEFKEAARAASDYNGIKEAAGVEEAEWAEFVQQFFDAGGKAPEV